MAGQPITRQRIEHFDEMGEDEVFDAYLSHTSVRKMLKAFGYTEPQMSTTIRAFYKWLDQEEGRRERWEKVLEIEGHEAKERIDDVINEATSETTNLARLKVDHLKWKAESLTKRYGKQNNQNVNVTINAQNAWLGALRQAEQQAPAIEEADYEVLPSGEDSDDA